MVVSALLVLALKPRVVLKPTHDPLSPEFRIYRGHRTVAVWVDRWDTGVRVPDWREDPNWAIGFEAVRELSNKRGDLGGEFNEIYRGAMNGTYHHPFAKAVGMGFVVLPCTAGNNNPIVKGIDENGRLLTVDDPPLTGLSKVSHAWLWSGSAWIDLGPARRARFDRDGSVVGAFPVDREGRPLAVIEYGGADDLEARFRWKDGVRTESKPMPR